MKNLEHQGLCFQDLWLAVNAAEWPGYVIVVGARGVKLRGDILKHNTMTCFFKLYPSLRAEVADDMSRD